MHSINTLYILMKYEWTNKYASTQWIGVSHNNNNKDIYDKCIDNNNKDNDNKDNNNNDNENQAS
jgi:hypothetical protein